MKNTRIKSGLSGLVAIVLLSCISFNACRQDEAVSNGYTDPGLVVRINPLAVVLQEPYGKADALYLQWYWTGESEFDNNPDVEFTLEIARAGTDFEAPYYCVLGKDELQGERWFTVQELNELLITNGILGNGEKGDVEARIIATESSYRGCRSEVTGFTVSTYYIDPNKLPPYNRVWFVGDFTQWAWLEMKRTEQNPFVFTIDFTFNPEDVRNPGDPEQEYGFKFGINEPGSDRQWFNMYHPKYKDAPITETEAVQVENDVTNDFKWSVEEKYWGHSFRISLDITPGKEKMICTPIDGSQVVPTPPDEGGDGNDGDTPVVTPPDGADPFSFAVLATDCETGGDGVSKANGRVEGMNAWRDGYINIEVDAPYEGSYYLISTLDCWDTVEFSFNVTDATGKKTLQIVQTDVANANFEHRCVVRLNQGANTVVISGGSGNYMDGYAPNFHKFIISNGATNFPGNGAEGNNQGEY